MLKMKELYNVSNTLRHIEVFFNDWLSLMIERNNNEPTHIFSHFLARSNECITKICESLNFILNNENESIKNYINVQLFYDVNKLFPNKFLDYDGSFIIFDKLDMTYESASFSLLYELIRLSNMLNDLKNTDIFYKRVHVLLNRLSKSLFIVKHNISSIFIYGVDENIDGYIKSLKLVTRKVLDIYKRFAILHKKNELK